MGDVVSLKPGIVGDGASLDPDAILEANKGKLVMLIVGGFDEAGDFHLASTHGSRDALWLIERARVRLMLETTE